jgi:hypothetical protein
MPLTKLFKDTVKARIERDPAFQQLYLKRHFQPFLKAIPRLGKPYSETL